MSQSVKQQNHKKKVRKEIDPPLLRVIRWIFPKLEVVAPFLANKLFITIFFTPLKISEPPKEKANREKAEQGFIEVAGKQVATYVWGDGEKTVLLNHGWMGRAGMLRKFIPALNKAGFKVVSFDGPAHGRSSGRQSNVLEFEQVVLKLDELYGPFEAIVGHSYGGIVGVFSIARGLNCRKMVVIGTPTQANQILKQYLKRVNGSWERAENFKRWVRKRGLDFEENDNVHLVKKLDQDIELLIVHDEEDREVLIDDAIALKEAYPKAETYFTKGLGHNRILKSPEVIEQVVEFLTP